MNRPGYDAWPLTGRDEELARCASALASDGGRGVVVSGPRGVGRSRFVQQLRGTPRILMVDDAHELPAAAAARIRQLMDSSGVKLVATIRDGAAIGAAVGALVYDHAVTRVELGPLREEQVRDLIDKVLGGPVRHESLHRLFVVSEGLPLLLREFAGSLVFDGAVWELKGEPSVTPALAELARAELSAAGPGGRLLDTLALCGPISLGHAARLGSPAILLDLERAGLVRARLDGRRTTIALARRLHGLALAASLPPARRASLLLAAARQLGEFGARRRDDPYAMAAWRLAAAAPVGTELRLAAAAAARLNHDHGQVAALLRPVAEEHLGPAAGLALGEALSETGEHDSAEAVLRRCGEQATAEADQRAATVARVLNLFWFGGRADPALAVIAAARTTAAPGELSQGLLDIDEAAVRTFAGDLDGGLRLLEPALQTARAVDVAADTWLRGANARSIGLAAAGRAVEGVAFAEYTYNVHLRAAARSRTWLRPAGSLPSRTAALAEAGRLTEARVFGRRAFEELASSDRPGRADWAALFLGRLERLAGHPVSARRWYGEAAAMARARRQVVPHELALVGLAAAAALTGDAAAVRDAHARLPEHPVDGFWPGEEQIATASLLAGRGRLDDARTALETGAQAARAAGHWSSEALLLTDIARLGGAASVADRLAELARGCEGLLVVARARFAAGLAADDPEQLLTVSREAEALGADLLAAEAASAAAALLTRRQRQRAATAAIRQAQVCAARCEGARTPLLAAVGGATRLSDRERQVARLAADGAATKEIARRLSLSVRTVENHLQKAYRKLGVSARADLAEALTR
ncbi:helix-turn-helix transcriptional regulator [Dactylosporangium sp. NPDC049525]|uniref:helix-turn-helix transcriptional regulator n=1 Tax=Dactylosporangium sp. NPDC049525 TaxID=3154730 RepID=UPI003421F844